MKKTLWLATMAAFVFVLGVYPGHAQPMGLGMMGSTYGTPPDEDWDYCHYCGNYPGPGYGMGPGRMGYGYGMGPWMMHRGYGMMGPGYGYGYEPRYGYGRAYRQPVKPLDENQIKQEVENYLKSTRNPNLKMGKIEERAQDYEVDIETKDGALVNKLLVDKDTGWMRSVY